LEFLPPPSDGKTGRIFLCGSGVAAHAYAPLLRPIADAGYAVFVVKWVEIKGGNHSQFGHYGPQLFDGTATVTREEQQPVSRSALLAALAIIEK
jgi:hypothetical protein